MPLSRNSASVVDLFAMVLQTLPLLLSLPLGAASAVVCEAVAVVCSGVSSYAKRLTQTHPPPVCAATSYEAAHSLANGFRSRLCVGAFDPAAAAVEEARAVPQEKRSLPLPPTVFHRSCGTHIAEPNACQSIVGLCMCLCVCVCNVAVRETE